MGTPAFFLVGWRQMQHESVTVALYSRPIHPPAERLSELRTVRSHPAICDDVPPVARGNVAPRTAQAAGSDKHILDRTALFPMKHPVLNDVILHQTRFIPDEPVQPSECFQSVFLGLQSMSMSVVVPQISHFLT